MKTILTSALLCFLGCSELYAQERLQALFVREIHVANSMGWGFPLGQTSEVLRPKYSTNLGLDIGLKDQRHFLFPSLDFLSFKYDQKVTDPDYSHQVENANSNFYMLNLAGGRRITAANFGFHVYAGPGIGLVSEPRAVVDNTQLVRLKNSYFITPSARIGAGSHYQLGNVRLFFDLSYLYNFRKTQERPTQVLTVYGGLRTNITRVADKVIEIISDQTQ